MKRCKKCNETKPLNKFYKRPITKDGHEYECKECRKKIVRDRFNNLDYDKKHKPTKEQKSINAKKHRKRYPEKILASNKIQYRIRKNGYNFHHWSYNEKHYEDIIDLLFRDHMKIHRFMIYDQKYMMFRVNKTGKLLNTKEKHINFINFVLSESVL